MKKVFAILIAAMICSVISYAQNLKEHVVAKGETLESIAQHYGVTVAKIQEVNPNVKNYIYVGQKINIPVAEPQAPVKPETTASNVVVSTVENHNSDVKPVSEDTSYSVGPHGYYGLFMLGSFSGKMKDALYGFGWSLWTDDGIGVQFFGGSNIFCKNWGDNGFGTGLFGLNYSIKLADNIYLQIPAISTGVSFYTEEKYDSKTDKTKKKEKVEWAGMLASTNLIVDLYNDKVFLAAGVNVSHTFKSGAKAYGGYQISFGVNF